MPPHQKQPNSIDLTVGSRVRLRRNMLQMSQEKLAGSVGISFQQIQKYETGMNRISASRLQSIAEALEVSPSYFFEESVSVRTSSSKHADESAPSDGLIEFLSSADGLSLNLAFAKIGDVKVRRRVVELAKAIAATNTTIVTSSD